MKRAFLIVCSALALAACSTPPAVDLASPKSAPPVSIQAVGTLATNPCEAAVAPLQTRAIVGVNTATRQLRAGQIDAAQAQAVADAAREVQAAARAACVDKRQPSPGELKRAQAALARIGHLTGSTQ
jgi:hypothetical protein